MNKKDIPWYNQFTVLSLFVSLLLHICVILCFVFYNQLLNVKDQPQRNILSAININLVTADAGTLHDNADVRLISNIKPAQPAVKEIKNLFTQKAHVSSPKKDNTELPKKISLTSSYGITLSAHIHNNIINLPQDIPSKEKIDIQVKIDKSGQLIEYKILSIHDEEIDNYIEQLLLRSSPFPAPVINEDNVNSVIYEFSLFLF